MGAPKKTAAQEAGRDKGGRMASDQKKSTAEDGLTPLTSEERDSWNGFCEIENEPALFNAILKDIGVKGVKVQEVVSLDEEMLAFLPKPIYGLIFLFRWREDDPHKQEQSCPESLWFANQTVENACATVALLNIIYNIEDIEMGEELKSFREFTKDLNPAMRGYAIGNFEFVKKVHNSFARKMDILNADLLLKNQQKRKAQGNQELDESEAGFHFIAFVKAKERVWKFDGLERQPQSLGKCVEEDWLGLATKEIQTKMAEYEEEEIEFSILSLSKDPMTGYLADLASNVKALQHLNSRLARFGDNCDEADPENAVLCGPDAQYGLTPAMLELALVPSELAETTENGNKAHDLDSLARQRQALVEQQRLLRTQITDEQHSRQIELDYARRRRFDYCAAVNRWSRILARKRKCEELLS
ncbi:Ubiquitin carboxyl-terminal hydrolase [Trichophyton interdigitale]|uniref:Ubiquitin carboxyl-terminal hydrolase n=1 Tax=Trichophyton interdigitale TaxID=101480 RepID=A0A9P4YES3_9EURO|nr:Ubiquitin carboxyl-terminal hydrolase [Trichophyton interdigitale]KAF3894301.1 Ubiquitin carboxyl-terminal hydrolase [Trichophyton interdigitale]KAG8207903.1 Ubiquitin carboxyl-terminal hydrolase [Trichophyton interdigitale]